MKNLICSVFLALVITSFGFSQDATPLSFEKIETVSKTKTEIYLASRLWFFKNFQSYEGVISVDDFKNGVLYGKGSFAVLNEGNRLGSVTFSIRIYFKENSYKVIASNFIHEVLDNSGLGNYPLKMGVGLLDNSDEPAIKGVGLKSTTKKILEQVKFNVNSEIKLLFVELKQTIENNEEMEF